LFNEAFALRTVILRYFNVFGPRQDPSSPYSGVISIFVDKLSQGLAPTIFGDGQHTRDFVFVGDVVRANLLAAAAEQAAGQIFNIGTGQQVTIDQLFESLCRLFECDLTPTYGPPRPGDIVHSYSDPGQARTVLDWQAQVSLEEGLKRLMSSIENSQESDLSY
jgi:nucleoside-diphosphate-sugar epimerase